MRHTIMICLLFLAYQFCQAQEQSQFTQGTDLLKSENYKGAIAQYESILENGQYSTELYQNLAQAYFQTKAFGKSMLAIERGLAIEPNNTALLHDKEILKNEIESDIFEVPPFAPIRIWRALTLSLSPNTWVLLQLLGLVMIIAILYFRWLRPLQPQPTWAPFAKYLGAFLVCLSTLALLSVWHQKTNNRSAIVLEETMLYNGPDERSGSTTTLPEGEKIAILEDFDGWWKVKLLNLEEGYVPLSKAEKI